MGEEICPVCEGEGYLPPGVADSAGIDDVCWMCDGEGVIYKEEE